jgi:hypothetical protein
MFADADVAQSRRRAALANRAMHEIGFELARRSRKTFADA